MANFKAIGNTGEYEVYYAGVLQGSVIKTPTGLWRALGEDGQAIWDGAGHAVARQTRRLAGQAVIADYRKRNAPQYSSQVDRAVLEVGNHKYTVRAEQTPDGKFYAVVSEGLARLWSGIENGMTMDTASAATREGLTIAMNRAQYEWAVEDAQDEVPA